MILSALGFPMGREDRSPSLLEEMDIERPTFCLEVEREIPNTKIANVSEDYLKPISYTTSAFLRNGCSLR
jgi:hypothetical protein